MLRKGHFLNIGGTSVFGKRAFLNIAGFDTRQPNGTTLRVIIQSRQQGGLIWTQIDLD